MPPRAFLAVFLSISLAPGTLSAGEAEGMAFFEKKIRPVLVEHCYSCHSQNAKKVRGGLLLDTRDATRQGGDNGPAVVPGQPDKSLLIHALRNERDLAMPPKGKLPDAVIADFVRWVEMGAPDPRVSTAVTPRRVFKITEADRKHWAFQPVRLPSVPRVQDENWCRSALDRFILTHLEDKKLKPGPEADRYTLLRRITFDLTGLPPTPDEIQAFVADQSATAYEKVVDRLLGSKEFGVRWARHWLDGVRYASDVDKSGLYRDWVVRAFNQDMPFAQFVRMQIAGDLIPSEDSDPNRVHASGASPDGVVATGMLALAVWEKVGLDLAVAEIVDSQIDVLGRQFLGLTLACGRCHDHKFDPISTKDYYALAGIFFSSHISPGKLIADGRLNDDVIGVPLLTRVDAEKNARIDEQIKDLTKEIATLEAKAGPAARLLHVREQIREMTPKLESARGSDKKKLAAAMQQCRAEEKTLLEDRARKGWSEKPPELEAVAGLRKKVSLLEKTKTKAVEAIAIQEQGVPGSKREKIGDAPVLIRGDHRKEGPIVSRRFPMILAGEQQTPLGERTTGSGRLELADWLASPENPLPARVMVNRIWSHLFGRGLVRTPDNFGLLGEPPSHPELLDYLASHFLGAGGSVKQLIREIVLSNAYRESSFAEPAVRAADPENRLLGRMNRKRLEYEALRDSILLVSGQLQNSSGRRTLYEPVLRRRIDPTRVMFDGPDPLTILPERAATTTSPQALFMMNNTFVAKATQRIAEQMPKDGDVKKEIEKMYLRLLGRPAVAAEVRIGEEYLARSSWSNYLQVLFCTNEFMYLD